MIYTITFSPSLDYIIGVNSFKLGYINRTSYEKICIGGKGINVSIVLKNLGLQSTILGFIGDFVGEEIQRKAIAEGLNTDFIKTKGISRINIKIKNNIETAINGQGVVIDEKSLQNLCAKLSNLKEKDVVVLAGAVPNSSPSNIYQKIFDTINKSTKVVVDATGDLLKNILKYKPFLIKPNVAELEEIVGKKCNCEDDIIKYGKQLQKLGAKNVLISRAKDGAILIEETGKISSLKAPVGQVVNSTGAGDSMVAGFLYGILTTKNYEQALKLGLAAGSASTFSLKLATKAEIYDILKKL